MKQKLAKPNSCPLCTGRWAPPHPFSKLLTHLDPSIESPWPLPSRALRFDLYLCRFGWEMETWKWENIVHKEPGPFHVTKMKDANTRWKDKHEGKRRCHENVSFSLRISVYSWVSHTVNTQRVLFPESLRNKEECKKTIVTRRIQTVELLQQEIAEKNPECRV